MPDRWSFRAAILVHVIAWWGVRILSSRAPFMHAQAPDSAAWWLVRLGRAVLTVAIVLGWAAWREVKSPELGLEAHGFWRRFFTGGAVVAVMWIAIGSLRGSLVALHAPGYGLRALAAATALIDVLAQQLATFGLLQGLGSSRLGRPAAFVLAWLSFTLAHLVIAKPPVVATAAVAGLVFGLLFWRTRSLAAGLGAHFGFYFMRAALGWGA